MKVYITVAGEESGRYEIIGVYYNKNDARQAMTDWESDPEPYLRALHEGRLKSCVRYAEVKEYEIK